MTSNNEQVKKMPVYKKPSHGKVHLYGGKGKSQSYIGPMDDPKKWDIKIARETLERDGRIFDKQFKKYLENLLLLSLYMTEQERKDYLLKRYAELLASLGHLNRKQK